MLFPAAEKCVQIYATSNEHLPGLYLGSYNFSEKVCPQYLNWLRSFICSCVYVLFSALRKRCLYLELFWFAFSCIPSEYGEIRSISPYSVQMWEKWGPEKLQIQTLFMQCMSVAWRAKTYLYWNSDWKIKHMSPFYPVCI